MTDNERIECFLTNFKELENKLLSIAKIREEGFVSFSRALNDIYYGRKNSVLSVYENYDFLKTCSDLRNILSHENDVCAPKEEFLSHFLSLKESICHPVTCYQICTKKIYSCKESDSLFQTLKLMEYHSLSHLPVLDDDGCACGVFSRETLFDFTSMNEGIVCDQDTTISLFSEFLPFEEHLNERFLFVSKNERIDTLYPLLLKQKEHQKRVSLLFVTEHGRRGEKLLGIISVTDLSKYRLD